MGKKVEYRKRIFGEKFLELSLGWLGKPTLRTSNEVRELALGIFKSWLVCLRKRKEASEAL